MKTNLFLVISLIIFGAQTSRAQIDIEGKVKSKVINRVDQKVDEGIDKSLDAVEDGIDNPSKNESQDEENNENTNTATKQTKKTTSDNTAATAKQETKLTSATKYDFVPGDKVLLFDDFSQDEIGDFPALWTTNGSGEVRTLNLYPGKWFYMNADHGAYGIIKKLELPENYIIEFDVVPTVREESGNNGGFELTLYQSSDDQELDNGIVPGYGGIHFDLSSIEWECRGYKEGNYGMVGSSELAPIELDKMSHVIIWVQKRRVRYYHKGQKVIDMPTVMPEGIKFDRLRFALAEGLPYITNLRITTAAPDMRSKLLTEGKLVSYGIYFDVNSDKVKPESAGTLKEIAKVLSENPTVKIKIIGHTDGDGDAAKNLDLSKRRAASVKTELSSTFGIDASRIETDGKGKTEPLATNDTPQNKAKNRRVEFIKL